MSSVDVDSGSGVSEFVGSDADGVSTGTTGLLKGVLTKNSGGLLVILASVRQQGLYPPVEAVPPKPSSLCSLKA
ncbi:MAG: hypothetical protein WBB01_15625 [Phormidesmis sp.]